MSLTQQNSPSHIIRVPVKQGFHHEILFFSRSQDMYRVNRYVIKQMRRKKNMFKFSDLAKIPGP